MKFASGFALAAIGFLMAGCVESTLEPTSEANFKPRDRELLAKAPYEQASIPEPYRRHIVDYHRKEAPGTIVVDSDNRYLYYVLPKGMAVRYGIAVGEEAQAWSGVAKVGPAVDEPADATTIIDGACVMVPVLIALAALIQNWLPTPPILLNCSGTKPGKLTISM